MMAKDRPPTYTPAPELPADPVLRQRFTEIVAVLAQAQTVSAAARSLGLSRNHFQTILHRVIQAMLDELTPKPAGRPAKPEREAALEAENAQLRAELESLRDRSAMIEKMMTVVGGIASGKTPLPRTRAKKTKPEDPEPATEPHPLVTTMREVRAPASLCGKLLGLSASTIRRIVNRPSPKPRKPRFVDDAACAQVRAIVRRTHGVVGARNLGLMTGVPRRQCARLKRAELRDLESERKARCARVLVAEPDVMRGFDAMHVEAAERRAYWLVAADAAVPYRTSITTVTSYDAASVLRALTADLETHGAPLVYRLDRIACQRTPEIARFLLEHQILPLHGPPRYPRYYGQLERQNRDHRAWYERLGVVSLRELAAAAEAMRTALNSLWPRPTLGGCTAEQAWHQRRPLDVDRLALRRDVDSRAAGLRTAGRDPLAAHRAAVEAALTARGLLTIKQGGWC